MRRLGILWLSVWFAALFAFSCHNYRPDPGPSSGGMPAVGGTSSIINTSSFGGLGGKSSESSLMGGFVSFAGSSSATTTAPPVAIEWPECAETTRKLEKTDVEHYRHLLGRRVVAGPSMRLLSVLPRTLDLPPVLWEPLADTLDQGDLGSCTGNAGIQCLVSAPFRWDGPLDAETLEALAVSVYSGATRRDPFPGQYPPDDTGSDGASVMAELRARNFITGWTEVVTLEGIQRALQSGPCSMGSNWYESMFTPDRCGNLSINGKIAGGHQTAAKGADPVSKRILFFNSWGRKWGAQRRGQGGWFWLSFANVQRLIEEGADFQCPWGPH